MRTFIELKKISLEKEHVETKDFPESGIYILHRKGKVESNDFVFVDSNSFIVDDQIIQMKLNSNHMVVEVKNFEGKLIKQFEITDDKDFEYKNSLKYACQKQGLAIDFINKKELSQYSAVFDISKQNNSLSKDELSQEKISVYRFTLFLFKK